MSQHDYDIANGGGATVRADINAALAAILSANSGATAPTTTKPFMPWYDTTNGVLKMRNAADTAWVSALEGVGGSTSIGYRNRVINGDIRINQRATGAQVPLAAGVYLADRWIYNANQNTRYSAVAETTSPPTGFTHYLRYVSATAFSPASTDWQCTEQRIEGLNVADLGWGTASAQSVTISFWVKSSLTGTHSGAINNGGTTRSYPFTYTINSASTWEYKTVVIPGDTTGTWAKDNSIGISLRFNLGTGSTYLGTAGSWTAAQTFGASGSVNVSGTNGAVFEITAIQLEAGAVATPFERVDYSESLRRCQRYCPVWDSEGGANKTFGSAYVGNSTSGGVMFTLPVTPRIPPTGISLSGNTYFTGAASANLTALTYNNAVSNVAFMGWTVASGVTAGQAGVIQSGAGGAKIIFTGCEL